MATRKKSVVQSIMLGTCRVRFDRAQVMGVVNATPDSFSGDGLSRDTEAAVARGLQMLRSGAALVDVGGESTRPGAEPVTVDEELARVIPVVEGLSADFPNRVSIDTMKPQVAVAALQVGATIVNDVGGLGSKAMIEAVAEHDAGVIVMHMLGEPRTMQVRPRYRDVISDILRFLEERVAAAESGGIDPRKIMVDPGIGFGKTLDHNLRILAELREFRRLGKPVVIGASRKSFIGKLSEMPADQRLGGSVAAALIAVQNGADMVRVHDVAETLQALSVYYAIG